MSFRNIVFHLLQLGILLSHLLFYFRYNIFLFFIIVTDVRAAAAAFLFVSYCFYYLCTVSVLGK